MKFKPKMLKVRPGERTSYQSHKYRTEIWFVYKTNEKAFARRHDELRDNDYTYPLHLFSTYHIFPNTKHQIINEGDTDLVILEWQMGHIVEESDITRYE